MQTKEVAETKKTTQHIQLVKGEFTPEEASEIILALIDQKINFHNAQKLQIWEKDHTHDTAQLYGRIKELQEEKRIVKSFISQHRGQGKNLKINGILEIAVAD